MITLRQLNISQFISHESTEITFDENSKMLFDGASGAGKSSIFEAIVWCLYGEGRASNASLVRSGSKKAIVTLELVQKKEDKADDTITLQRAVTSGGKHTLSVTINGVAHPLTGVRELQAWIETDLIGASYLLFINSVAYLQGNVDSFVSQNAAKRKEILLEIVKADDYDKLYDKASAEIKTTEGQILLIDKQIDIYSASASALQTRVAGKEKYSETIAAGEIRIGQLEVDRTSTQNQIDAARLANKAFHELEMQLKDATAKETVARMNLDNGKKRTESRETLVKKLETLPDTASDIQLVTEKITTAKNTLTALMGRIDQRNKVALEKPSFDSGRSLKDIETSKAQWNLLKNTLEKSPSCPSGDACPYVGQMKDSMNTAKREYEEKVNAFAEGTKNVDAWKSTYDALVAETAGEGVLRNEIAALENTLRSLQQVSNARAAILTALDDDAQNPVNLDSLLSEYDNTKRQVEHMQKNLAIAPHGFDNAIALLEISLRGIDDNIKKAQMDVAEAKTMLSVLVEQEAQMRTAMEKIALLRIEKETDVSKMQKLALIKEAFGSKGIKTVVIDYVLPKLEDKINEILHQLSDFTVHLDTQTDKADGDGSKEGLWITVTNDMGQEMPFEAFSGGERLKITVAISEAFASLQKVGFRLMDELWIGLDDESTESFAHVMEKLQERFGQILCISHLRTIKDLFYNVLTINKRNGISYVSRE